MTHNFIQNNNNNVNFTSNPYRGFNNTNQNLYNQNNQFQNQNYLYQNNNNQNNQNNQNNNIYQYNSPNNHNNYNNNTNYMLPNITSYHNINNNNINSNIVQNAQPIQPIQPLIPIIPLIPITPQSIPQAPETKEPVSETSKTSLGIACCRITNDRPEILLVCKRYTYAFADFVHGKYNLKTAATNNDIFIKMFNKMTFEEKLDILSLNFSQMWYRIWLNNNKKSGFYLCKNKFESVFMPDNGVRLQKLISHSGNVQKNWEIPKGRKKNKNESNINCAVREFGEETNITKRSYKLFPSAKRTYAFIDSNVKYINTYYIAYTKYKVKPKINIGMQTQVDELSDIRWMNIEEIRTIDYDKRLETFITPIFNYIKKRVKVNEI